MQSTNSFVLTTLSLLLDTRSVYEVVAQGKRNWAQFQMGHIQQSSQFAGDCMPVSAAATPAV